MVANKENKRLKRQKQELFRKSAKPMIGNQLANETEDISKPASQTDNNEEINDDGITDNDSFMGRNYYEENQQDYYFPRDLSQSNLSQKVPPPAVSPPQHNINFSLSKDSQKVPPPAVSLPQENIHFPLNKDFNNPMSIEDRDYLSNSGKEQLNTIAVQDDVQNSESISTVTEDKSFESGLLSKSNEELIQILLKMRKQRKKGNEDLEEINEMTVNEVLKCSKYDLFKRVQFIRHQSVLREYEKKGSIGRFVMRKLKIEKSRRKIFWNTYFPVVRKGIKSQRNIIHTNIRRKFLGKLCAFFLKN